VGDEWRADAVKKDTCLSHINLLREQFAKAACQKGIDVLTPPTHSNIGTDVMKSAMMGFLVRSKTIMTRTSATTH
jgi:hypothetical protein